MSLIASEKSQGIELTHGITLMCNIDAVLPGYCTAKYKVIITSELESLQRIVQELTGIWP